MEFLEAELFGNTMRAWLIALSVVVVGVLFLRLLQRLTRRHFRRLAERTEARIDDTIAELIGNTQLLFLLLISVYVGSQFLTLPEKASQFIGLAAFIGTLIQLGLWGNDLILHFVTATVEKRAGDAATRATTINALGVVGKVVLWTIILLLALDNIPGVEVETLIASLGISGIAAALAVQSILGDLFASLSIVLDKPFEIGDFIIVGDLMGTIEKIGLRSTRVRSLYGEQLIFSNADLLNSRIRNYKRMAERRVVFTLGVTYETPHQKLDAIPGMIREIITAQEKARFDRAHFKEYGDSSLNFEVVYYVLTADYNLYMDIQQAINLSIYQRFEQEGIEFAFPTQTVYVQESAEV